MRPLMFSLFRRLSKLENVFSGKGVGKIPGVGLLYRLMHLRYDWMYYKLRPKGIVSTNIQGNKMYVNADDLGIVRMMLLYGVWEKYETELFKKTVGEGMVVVDIGAHVGYYSLIGAKLVGKSGIVYAFEPEPSSYELLCKNIEANGYANVVPIQKAISDKHGKVNLWVDKFSLASACISEDNVVPTPFYNVSKKVFVEVETITLDEFFENEVKNNKVDFIKMDVGGAEGLIVEGAERILKSNNLKILMEFGPDLLRNLGTDPLELLCKLQNYGFKMECINERKQVLEPIESIPEFCRNAKPREEFNLLLKKENNRRIHKELN